MLALRGIAWTIQRSIIKIMCSSPANQGLLVYITYVLEPAHMSVRLSGCVLIGALRPLRGVEDEPVSCSRAAGDSFDIAGTRCTPARSSDLSFENRNSRLVVQAAHASMRLVAIQPPEIG